MEWWGWLLALAGGISAIGGAAGVIGKWIRPAIDVSRRLKEIELHDDRDLRRFDRIEKEAEHQAEDTDAALHELRRAIITLVMHNLYGNHDKELKEQLNNLQSK